MKRVLSFFGRRLSPGEYLGLHLTLGLAISLAALAIFVLIGREVVGERELTAFDHDFAVRMQAHANAHPVLLHCFRFVTNLGGLPAITTLTLVGGLLLALQRRRALTIVWFAAAAGGGLINVGLKAAYERDRPPPALRDAAVTETNESFPSGHSMGSVIGYGMLGYVLVLRQRRRVRRLAVATALAALVLAIGVSRVYLRAHWFSDVCGGFAVGTVWLTGCISALEVLRRRRQARQQERASGRGTEQRGAPVNNGNVDATGPPRP